MTNDKTTILENSIKAFKLTTKIFGNYTDLKRALFLGWYCNLKNPCKFCFMASQKSKIKNPKIARRKIETILAEAIIMKRIGWKLEFISGGYGYSIEELNNIIEQISYIQKSKQYLNLGVIDFEKLNLNVVEGVVGAIETVNPKLHNEICPDKPIKPVKDMLLNAKDNYNLKTGITIILGLGEKEEDLELLLNLIEELQLDRITFYSLNPQKDTIYYGKPSINTLDYMNWISTVRLNFPKIEIIAGSWVDKLTNIGPLVISGANTITKFPLFAIYGKKEGITVENEIKSTGRILISSFSDLELLSGKKTVKFPQYKNENIKISENNKLIVDNMENIINEKINRYVNKTIKRTKI